MALRFGVTRRHRCGVSSELQALNFETRRVSRLRLARYRGFWASQNSSHTVSEGFRHKPSWRISKVCLTPRRVAPKGKEIVEKVGEPKGTFGWVSALGVSFSSLFRSSRFLPFGLASQAVLSAGTPCRCVRNFTSRFRF